MMKCVESWKPTGIIQTRTYKDKVYVDLYFLGGKVGISVPEEFIPDEWENKQVQVELAPRQVGKSLMWFLKGIKDALD